MKRAIRRLELRLETVRSLTVTQLRNAHGGAIKISEPTDEMGDCGSCPPTLGNCSLHCTAGIECAPPPP